MRNGARLLSVLLAGAGFVSARAAWADAAPAPACQSQPGVEPVAGSAVPGTLPAFRFTPPDYGYYTMSKHALAWYAFELRDGSGELVPIDAAPAPDGTGRILLRPARALAPGEAELSYLDDCGGYYAPRLLDPPMRKRVSYQVGPAVALPTRVGAVAVRSIEYHADAPDCHRPVDATVTLEVQPTPELLAFRALATLDARLARPSDVHLGTRFDEARQAFRVSVGVPCREELGGAPGPSTFELHAAIVGLAASIEPASVSFTVDCSERPAGAGAPFCAGSGGGYAEPSAGPEAGVPADIVDAGTAPDARPVVADAQVVTARSDGAPEHAPDAAVGSAPALATRSSGGCSVGPPWSRPTGAGAALVLLVLAAIGGRRRAHFGGRHSASRGTRRCSAGAASG
jgi:MYXO-CTERM domain-containing protein